LQNTLRLYTNKKYTILYIYVSPFANTNLQVLWVDIKSLSLFIHKGTPKHNNYKVIVLYDLLLVKYFSPLFFIESVQRAVINNMMPSMQQNKYYSFYAKKNQKSV